MAKRFVCPRCACTTYLHPALSRTDNATYVCSDCGGAEAIEQYQHGFPCPQSHWRMPELAIQMEVAK